MDEILGHSQEAMAILTVPDGESPPFEQVKAAYAELIEAEKTVHYIRSRGMDPTIIEYQNRLNVMLQKSYDLAKYGQLLKYFQEAKRLSEEIAAELKDITVPVL